MAFDKNVFVNCPFDTEYLSLLRPLLFTIIYLGFVPRIALESLDSGQPRVEKILELIQDSKYSIHDLSRIRASVAGEFFRLNMPFELGLDVGCKRFMRGKCSTKRCLILETEKYRFQAAISDISNSDIAVHSGDPAKVSKEVRNWLNSEAKISAPGPTRVWMKFGEFMAENHTDLTDQGFSDSDIDSLPVSELMRHMQSWVSKDQ
jgi:hypothetical protein